MCCSCSVPYYEDPNRNSLDVRRSWLQLLGRKNEEVEVDELRVRGRVRGNPGEVREGRFLCLFVV
jgi:hypothetical protein